MFGKYYQTVCCLAIISIHPSEECTPVDLWSAKLKQAEKKMTDGRLTLNTVKPVTGTSTLPPCSGQNVTATTLIRSPLGKTVTFHCTVPECASDPTACADNADGLLWLHQRYSVWHVLNNQSNLTSPFNYSVSTNATMSHLFIHNITLDAAGSVQCVRRGVLPDGHYCVVAVYDMKPLLTAADLFGSRSQHVTAKAGRNVTLRCNLQFPLSDYAGHRYIWRYSDKIGMAPRSHPVSGLISYVFPYQSRFEYNQTYTTLTLRNPGKSHSGRYECWVRPYFEIDEWIVKVIHLQLQ